MRWIRFHIVILLFLWGCFGWPSLSRAQLSPSQYDYPHNRLPWYTIETDHFNIHFQEGSSRSAQATAHIAEEVYPAITSLYHHEPDTKTNIVLNDRQDYSNGAAYFFDNQIEIWVPALTTPLRGTHDWLWDVVTHEFTHIVQLQTAMKKNRRIPAIYFQWLSYGDVRRPDVLYGYPKGIISYPFASINVPVWMAEGVAQYQRSKFQYDFWDSHRDMLLRTALLAGEPIDFEDMGIFTSKNSLERERIYNQGFAFTSYLAHKYGEQILPEISQKLAKFGIFTANEAIEKATGTSGKALFDEFVEHSTSAYRHAISKLSLTPTDTVQEEGFFNFYPKLSPSGNTLAYLSNKESRSGEVKLFIQQHDSTNNPMEATNLGSISFSPVSHHGGPLSDAAINHIQSDYSFSADGNSLVFSRQKLNQYGEEYNDLFIYDLKSGDEKRITHSQRLSSPAWHPDQPKIAAVKQTAGSSNLVLIDLKDSTKQQLTHFSNGGQVFTPTWSTDGQTIYFAFSNLDTRHIYKVDISSAKINSVLKSPVTNYRDPFTDASGNYLYYAADPDGIFNIYRIPIKNIDAKVQKLTSVIGGAFMPFVDNDKLYFSEFKNDGYKISSVNLNKSTEATGQYRPPADLGFKLINPVKDSYTAKPLDFDKLLPSTLSKLGKTDSLQLNLALPGNDSDPFLHPYENTYTSFSFYPVIRFDNYSHLNGSNSHLLTTAQFGELGENILRDMKLGSYFSSRDVTDKIRIYGGAMFGFASEPRDGVGDFFSPARLTDLDRDLFLTLQHQGLPFIKKRWSPTVSLEFYNLRRNVSDGLTIEEFPCTACLPDTTHADIAYNIWEADLFLRSKINTNNLVELGAGYSPYRVQTDAFYSRELQQLIPSSSSEYFRGTTFTAAYVFENFTSYPDEDVAPLGLRTMLRYSYEPNQLLDDYEIKDGSLAPVYKSTKNHSLEATLQYGHHLFQHSSVNFYAREFNYFNQPDDYFYLDYIGGFTGMRSYPYFAIGGNTTLFTQLSCTFPILQNMHEQVGRYTLDKLFLRLFGETGNGWGGPLEIGDHLKTGVGAELRFALNSYYLFPLKLFVSGSYGFNKFDVTLPEAFITESSNGRVTYGNELLFHFGLTFDFNILDHD